jgi:hypothetical protein
VFVAPLTGDVVPSSSPVTTTAPDGPPPVRSRDVRVAIALAPQGDLLGRIEVLRGRRVSLWMRATVDGSPARVAAWTLVSGDLTALGPISGSGEEPLVATWRTLSAAPFTVRVSVTVEVPGDGGRELEAAIDVIVRSPALVE